MRKYYMHFHFERKLHPEKYKNQLMNQFAPVPLCASRMAGTVFRGLCGVVLLVCCSLLPWCSAVNFIVGDSSGWNSGYSYSAWTRDRMFSIGDTLRFNYAPGAHTVAEVSAGDYSSCTAANVISTDSSGSTTISLVTAGSHFFICTVPGHCAGGMKLVVTVGGGATPSAPTQLLPPPSNVTLTTPVNDKPSSCGRLDVHSAALVLAGIVAVLGHALF